MSVDNPSCTWHEGDNDFVASTQINRAVNNASIMNRVCSCSSKVVLQEEEQELIDLSKSSNVSIVELNSDSLINETILSTQIPCGQRTPLSSKYANMQEDQAMSQDSILQTSSLPSVVPELHYGSSGDEPNSFVGFNPSHINIESNPSINKSLSLSYNIENSVQSVILTKKGRKFRNPIINATLASQNQGKIIIISIIDENAANLLMNPFKINTLLTSNNSQFKDLEIKDIRINRMKKLIIIETEYLQETFLSTINNIDKLGSFKIRCYQPNSDKRSYGVIGPISVDVDLEEIKNGMSFKTEVEVISLERMKRKVNGNLEDSLSVKIILEGTELPRSVSIYGLYFKIRQFIPPPVQCYNCQRFGHTAGSCRTKPRCLICGEGHNRNECKSTVIRCANCCGTHVSSSRDCDQMKTAKEIETLKVTEKMSHVDARNRIMQGHSRHSSQIRTDSQYNEFPSQKSARTYREVLTQNNRKPVNSVLSNYEEQGKRSPPVDASTQTDFINVATQCSDGLH